MSPQPNETREEALRRLQGQADALEARTTHVPQDHGHKAAGYGYRILGLLLSGVFVGIGIGAALDAVAGTAPWGTIVGVLLGFVISIWMAVRSARVMAEEATREWGPPRDLGPEDDEDD